MTRQGTTTMASYNISHVSKEDSPFPWIGGGSRLHKAIRKYYLLIQHCSMFLLGLVVGAYLYSAESPAIQHLLTPYESLQVNHLYIEVISLSMVHVIPNPLFIFIF